MWASLFNDTACYSSHHFTSANTSGWRRLVISNSKVVVGDTAQERHVVSVPSTNNSSTSSYDVACRCVNQRVLLICRWDIVFILILAGYLLGALSSRVHAPWLTRLRWVLNELRHADSLLWALSVDNACIHIWLPIINLRWLLLNDRGLWLTSLLLLLERFVATAIRLGTESVVISQ